MDIGIKILKLRRVKKLSQTELCALLEISQTALCAIENGKTNKIDFVLMHKICRDKVDYDFFF